MFIYKVLFALTAVATAFGAPANASDAPPALDRTRVTPYMDVPVTGGKNIVYCATFQLAWNKLKDEIVGEDIRLGGQEAFVRALNRGVSTIDDIAESDYLVIAGTDGAATVKQIRQALNSRGLFAPAFKEAYPFCVVMYARLDAEIKFPHKFEMFEDPPVLYLGDERAHVTAFGIYGFDETRHGTLRDQVEILFYDSPRSFAVGLRSTRPDVDIVLAKVDPGATLLDTYERVKIRTGEAAAREMSKNDVLVIPRLNASVSFSYDNLYKLYLQNTGWEEFFVYDALQDLRFALDEGGIRIESDMRLALKQKGPPAGHKVMVFQPPYLLYLKLKEGNYPYFMVWVENDEMMIHSR